MESLTPEQKQQIDRCARDREWRLANLYQILKEGKLVPWEAYPEQLQFRRERTNRNFVPKARKLGLSTEIVIENGDECLWTPHLIAGVIDIKEEDAFAKLQIFRLAWERGPEHPNPVIAWLWQRIHKSNPLVTDNGGEMGWSNGAVFRAGTSFTGRTPQRLHISEYGPICAKSATVATDIQRGSINSVEPGGIIDIETTMEGGRAGLCYHYFTLAKKSAGKTELARSDWKLHFFPWMGHPLYREPGQRPTLGYTTDYFRDLKTKHGIELPDDRMAFWEAKRAELGDEIWCQYPSVIEEIERAVVVGAIYPEMAGVRAQGRVPERGFEPVRGLPFFTSWDLGSSDNMAGWLWQPAGKTHNAFAFACGEGQGAAGVAGVIREWERRFGQIAIHLLPHDANIHDKGSGKTYLTQLIECGIPASSVRVVPRVPDVWSGIDEVRKRLANTWFHPDCDKPVMDGLTETPSGVQRLEGYRKRVNAATGFVTSMPVKDGVCDHAADAVRTYAEADSLGLIHASLPRPEYTSWGAPLHQGPVKAITGFRR